MLNLTAHPYTLQFKHPAATSRGALVTRPVIFLRATDAEQPSIVGWGECGPMPKLSLDDRPDFAEQVQHVCRQINGGMMPEQLDLSQLPSLAFGLEIARRDLQTGGRQLLFNTSFCRGEAPLPTHGLIWMDTVAGILHQIEQKITQGFRVIKMKVGALPFDEECALLAAIRRQYSAEQITLRLDANGAFSPADALEKLRQLAVFDIHFLEQPIKAGQAQIMAEICAQSPIPLALDEELIGVHTEAARRTLLETIRPQHLIIKPLILGGFAASECWIGLAEALGSEWWVNSLLESNIGLNAICQWTSAQAGQRIHGLGTGQLFTNNIPSPLQLKRAQLQLKADGGWDFSCIQ